MYQNFNKKFSSILKGRGFSQRCFLPDWKDDFRSRLIELCPVRLPVYNRYFKVYNDGGHYVGTMQTNKKIFPSSNLENLEIEKEAKEKSIIDQVFDFSYYTGTQNGLKGKYLFDYIKNEIIGTYAVATDLSGVELDLYINTKIKIKIKNFHKRIKLFKRKANLNKWNYFCTFTYDDNKVDLRTFVKSLKKCLANLHCRKSWRYMGVKEIGSIGGRTHFHLLMYIPNGAMVGKIIEDTSYSIKKKCMVTTTINTFFTSRFGRTEFKRIDNAGMTIDYILKYLQKDNEKIFYSRGIPEAVILRCSENDVASLFFDFYKKYVLFDDVFDWERDVVNSPYDLKDFRMKFA